MIPLSDPELRHRTFPIVNLALIVGCALVFFYELSLGPSAREALFFRYGLIPRELSEGTDFTGIESVFGQITDIRSGIPPWGTIFTSMFLHGSISHFGFNMLFLWVFGDNVEDRLGHVKYLLFYLVSGIAAGVAQVVIDPTSTIPMIGASGAIAGSLGAYFLLYPFHHIRTLVIFFFITFVDIPAMLLLGFWIVMQFFGGLGSLGPSAQGQGGVAYFAHIGGFVMGMVLVAFMKLFLWHEPLWSARRRRDDFWWRGRRL